MAEIAAGSGGPAVCPYAPECFQQLAGDLPHRDHAGVVDELLWATVQIQRIERGLQLPKPVKHLAGQLDGSSVNGVLQVAVAKESLVSLYSRPHKP